jgi:RsmE family RNA methyltransferase
MNLIILTDQDALDGDRYQLSDHRADHIRQILKLGVGDTFEAGLLNGPQGTVTIERMSNDTIIVGSLEMKATESPAPNIDLICALPRPQTLKKVLFICGMMGVRRLDLIRANRVEKSYYHSPLLQPENYTPHLIEGLSQGKRTRLPTVGIHQRFRPFFEDTLPARLENSSEEVALLLPDMDSSRSASNVLSKKDRQCLWVGIGPEGGWVPFEIELMERLGFQRFSLGPWVLRVEHAVTATLAQIDLLRAQG